MATRSITKASTSAPTRRPQPDGLRLVPARITATPPTLLRPAARSHRFRDRRLAHGRRSHPFDQPFSVLSLLTARLPTIEKNDARTADRSCG
jgi:hypothetical protein